MERIAILCRRIFLFPEIPVNKLLYKNGSFTCSEAIFWEVSLWMVMPYFNFFCIWNSEPSFNSLKKIHQLWTVWFVLPGATIPVEMGTEAEFYGIDSLLSKSRVLQCCNFCVAGKWCIYHDLSHSLKSCNFQELPSGVGWQNVGFLDKGRVGNTSLLFPCKS